MDIESVLHQLTLEEKCRLTTGADFWHMPGVERIGIKPFMVADGPHGLRKQEGQADHLGLNASTPSTCFPTASASACSFDLDLLRRVGEALGEECREQGVSILLGPGVNMKRSPLCGRNFEYFSEDPILAGTLGASFIEGVQSRGVGTSLKHFVANNQETDRLIIDSVIDERALHELYLRPFEIAVRASRPWTVMTAYNLLNGVYCSEDHWLMTDIARKQWGFEGSFVTDWGALNSNTASIPAGLDLVMPGPRLDYRHDLADAVRGGRIAQVDLDDSVRRLLELYNKRDQAELIPYQFDEERNLTLAREVAEESAVLLENNGVLPLSDQGDYAIIGSFAHRPRYQGAGSSKINPRMLDTVLDALTEANITYAYASGYDALTGDATEAQIKEAVELASSKAVAVLFVGLPDSTESEGVDRATMDLPAGHVALIERVCAANPHTVVVIQGGSPVAMPWRSLPAAVLLTYLAGCQGGHAVARILFGQVNPSGKLAESWPLTLDDTPAVGRYPSVGRQAVYLESIYTGYRYYDTAGIEVAYPFGFGRSYTEFEYRDLRVVATATGYTASCTIENIGKCFGKETAQLYIAPIDSGIFKAYQELKGFSKVALSPGDKTEVAFVVPREAFSHYDSARAAWIVEQGAYELRIAATSRDVRLALRLSVEGEPKGKPSLDLDSYHQVRAGKFSLEEFKTLYGKPLPKHITAMRPYTINATIGDLRTSTLGRIIHYILRREIKNFTHGDPSIAAMLDGTVMNTPLRSVAMSGIDMIVIYGVVDVLNYHFFRGIRKILTKRN